MKLWGPNSRKAHPLHRMCPYIGSFPPQLPAAFLDAKPDAQTILDPFCGRGTVLLEANLRGKSVYGTDINPVALALSRVKLHCDPLPKVLDEIHGLNLDRDAPNPPKEVAPFFHPDTWRQVYWLRETPKSPTLTALALGRLHGHSHGFFSVKTFNVISVTTSALEVAKSKHQTEASPRHVKVILEKAARRFLPPGGLAVAQGDVGEAEAQNLPFRDNMFDLVITSPPFLDVLDYGELNWLRNWFLKKECPPTFVCGVEPYKNFLRQCLKELARVIKPEGHIVFEVGPVQKNAGLSDMVVEAAEGILHVERVLKHTFEDDAVPKISRAMSTDGAKTTTMENHCVVMRPLGSTGVLHLPEWHDPEKDSPVLDLFGSKES